MLAVLLCLFTVAEVNYPLLGPQGQLAIFAGLGLVSCFLHHPFHRRLAGSRALGVVDRVLATLAAVACLYVVVQTQPLFERFWIGGASLGNRAGLETPLERVASCPFQLRSGACRAAS